MEKTSSRNDIIDSGERKRPGKCIGLRTGGSIDSCLKNGTHGYLSLNYIRREPLRGGARARDEDERGVWLPHLRAGVPARRLLRGGAVPHGDRLLLVRGQGGQAGAGIVGPVSEAQVQERYNETFRIYV